MPKINPRLAAVVSAALVAFVATNEGTVLHTYPDQGGVWTACAGHTDKTLHRGQVFTQKECTVFLQEDLQTAAREVDKDVIAPINVNQRDALVDFTFNVGGANLRKSHLLTYTNQRNYTLAAKEFPKWDIVAGKHNKGVLKRRLREQALYMKVPSNEIAVMATGSPPKAGPGGAPGGLFGFWARLVRQT